MRPPFDVWLSSVGTPPLVPKIKSARVIAAQTILLRFSYLFLNRIGPAIVSEVAAGRSWVQTKDYRIVNY